MHHSCSQAVACGKIRVLEGLLKPRVLLVDDEAAILRSIARAIGQCCEVVTACNAAEGIAKLEGQKFDVIVSDFSMPGGDGITFLKTARVRFPNVRRILHTGTAPDNVSAQMEDGNVERFVPKAADMSEVVEAIASVVDCSWAKEQNPGLRGCGEWAKKF